MAASKPAPRSGRADADELVTLFSGALGPWQLKELEKPDSHASPAPQPLVRAVYAQGPQSVEVTVRADKAGGVKKGAPEVYRESAPQRDGALVVMTLANGVVIAATSRSADAVALEALIRAIDLGRAEALKPAKR